MLLYAVRDGKLERIREDDFKLERDLQKLCDDNLEALFQLKMVKSQFAIENFRIDTLAFDEEAKAFVVIEYKKGENFSVIDQGYTYLSLVLNNKAECVLAYQEAFGKPLRKTEVEWSQTRVIFVSPYFTTYQINSINFKDLPIELWKVKKFANNLVLVEQVQPVRANESIKVIAKEGSTSRPIAPDEVRTYTEEDHLARASESTKELYERLKERILQLGEVQVKATRHYIAFVASGYFADVLVRSKGLKVYLNMKKGELNDPNRLARDKSKVRPGSWDYEISVDTDTDLDYVMYLIKQCYEKNRA